MGRKGDPLAKEFPCQECGDRFRTRQGLSGHIRFKHGSHSDKDAIIDKMQDIMECKVLLEAKGQGLGLPASDIVERKRLLDQWMVRLEYCWTFGVRLNDEDFKDYIIRSLETRLH